VSEVRIRFKCKTFTLKDIEDGTAVIEENSPVQAVFLVPDYRKGEGIVLRVVYIVVEAPKPEASPQVFITWRGWTATA